MANVHTEASPEPLHVSLTAEDDALQVFLTQMVKHEILEEQGHPVDADEDCVAIVDDYLDLSCVEEPGVKHEVKAEDDGLSADPPLLPEMSASLLEVAHECIPGASADPPPAGAEVVAASTEVAPHDPRSSSASQQQLPQAALVDCPGEGAGSFTSAYSSNVAPMTSPPVNQTHLSQILLAYKALVTSGLACAQTIDYPLLMRAAQAGEVCLSSFYTRKLQEVADELRLNMKALEDLGWPLYLAQVPFLPPGDIQWYMDQIYHPQNQVQFEGLSVKDLSLAWTKYEEVLMSSRSCSTKHVREVLRAMPVGYKSSCLKKQSRVMGMQIELCRASLIGTELSKEEIDILILAHKTFLQEKQQECLQMLAQDIQDKTRSDIEELIDRRLAAPLGPVKLEWLEAMQRQIKVKIFEEQARLPHPRFAGMASTYPWECLAKHANVYPSLARESAQLRASARSLCLIPEEHTVEQLLLGRDPTRSARPGRDSWRKRKTCS